MTGKRLVFAGGAPRSGLTLLRAILSAHPHIFCGPDSGILPGLALQWREFATQLGALHESDFALAPDAVKKNFSKAIWTLLAEAPAASRKRLVVEKTPLNLLAFNDLAHLFPDAKFIHVVRDGRDVVASLLQRNWRDPQTGAPFAHVTDASAAAAYWSGLVSIGRQAEQAFHNPDQFYVLHYENLAKNPTQALTALFEFLDEPFDSQVANFYENDIQLVGIECESRSRLAKPINDDRVGRWRVNLSPAQIDIVNKSAGGMLGAFNYQIN